MGVGAAVGMLVECAGVFLGHLATAHGGDARGRINLHSGEAVALQVWAGISKTFKDSGECGAAMQVPGLATRPRRGSPCQSAVGLAYLTFAVG